MKTAKVKQKLVFFRIIFLFISIFIVFSLSISNSFASNASVNLNVGNQDILGNNLPIDLSVVSDTDLNGAKVQWIIPYGLQPVTGANTNYTTTLSGSDILYDHLVLNPQFPGSYTLTANVSSTQFNKSASVVLKINQNLKIENTNNSYDLRKAIYFVLSIVLLFVFVFMMRDVYNYFKQRFHNWLDKES